MMRYATSQKVTGSIPDDAMESFHWSNPFSCTVALELTQRLKKRVPGIFVRGKWWPVRKDDNLTAICEPII
jgi:hypothetical protein